MLKITQQHKLAMSAAQIILFPTIDWDKIGDEPRLETLADRVRFLRFAIPQRREIALMYQEDADGRDAEAWGEELDQTPGVPSPAETVPAKPIDFVAPAKRPFFSDLVAAYDNVGRGRPWFAEGAIEGAPMIIFAGPEKSHKSWTAMQLAVATVTGGSWLGRFPVRRKGQVVYFDGEYGEHEFARRIARIARGMGKEPREVLAELRHSYSRGMTLDMNDPILKLALAVIGNIKPSLIVLDPLRNHLAGNENDSDVVKSAYDCLGALRDAAGCPVLVIHHLNKSGGFSGSRAIVTMADLIVEGSDGDVPTYTTRGRTVRPRDPIAQPFSIVAEHDDDDDDTIAATRITYATDEAPATRAMPDGTSTLEKKILTFLDKQTEPRTANYIAKGIGGKSSNGAVKSALEDLLEKNHVDVVPDGVQFNGRKTEGWRRSAAPDQTSPPDSEHRTV